MTQPLFVRSEARSDDITSCSQASAKCRKFSDNLIAIMTESTNTKPGGFSIPSLLSPAPSNASSSSVSSNLPHPRSHPLKAGSAKEDAARRYVEGRLLHISRRYAKKFQPLSENESSDLKGYVSMNEVAKDLGEIVDVVWLSGTP